jgi:hypothetical protein
MNQKLERKAARSTRDGVAAPLWKGIKPLWRDRASSQALFSTTSTPHHPPLLWYAPFITLHMNTSDNL